MGCCVETFRAAIGCFAGVLVKILARYAAIAARRVRGYRSQGMCAMMAVTTLLVFLLIGGVEPNPGPDSNKAGVTDCQTSPSTLDGLSANIQTLMDKVSQLQCDIRTDMDQKLHDVGESIRHTVEASSQALRQDISKLQEDIDSVGEKVDENRERIERLEEENRLLAKGLAGMERELDMLESRSRRSNVRFFGIAESVGESFQTCADKVVSVLNEFFPCKTWEASDVERAHRTTGSADPATHKPRPLIVRFHRWADKMRLFQDSDARAALRMAGIRFSSDLTKRQVAALKEVRADGKFGFYKNGKLHVREDQDPSSGTQTSPHQADSIENVFHPPDFTDQDPNTRHDNDSRPSGASSADTGGAPPPQSQHGDISMTASASPRPQSPLFSEVVRNGRDEAAGSPSPGFVNNNSSSVSTTTNNTALRQNDASRGASGTPVSRSSYGTQDRVTPGVTSGGKSPTAAARGRGEGDRRGGGAGRGSRPGHSNRGNLNSRPNTRLQSQSLSLPPPLRDQPRISDRWNPTRRVSAGGRGQNSSDSHRR